MSLYIFDTTTDVNGIYKLEIPFAKNNIEVNPGPYYPKYFPKNLDIHVVSAGKIDSSNTRSREGLPLIRNGDKLVISDALRTPDKHNVGLTFGDIDFMNYPIRERMLTNTELQMQMDTFTDGVRKNILTMDPDELIDQALANFRGEIERAAVLVGYGNYDESFYRDSYNDALTRLRRNPVAYDRYLKAQEFRRSQQAPVQPEEKQSPREAGDNRQKKQTEKELKDLKSKGLVKGSKVSLPDAQKGSLPAQKSKIPKVRSTPSQAKSAQAEEAKEEAIKVNQEQSEPMDDEDKQESFEDIADRYSRIPNKKIKDRDTFINFFINRNTKSEYKVDNKDVPVHLLKLIANALLDNGVQPKVVKGDIITMINAGLIDTINKKKISNDPNKIRAEIKKLLKK